MRDPFRRGVRRQDQVDVNRDGRRCGNDRRRRLREQGLGPGGEHIPLDPHEFLPGGIEDSHARQRHRFGEHADHEKLVFDVVHAVVAADDLGVVNRTDQERSRPTRLLRGRRCHGWPSARRERKGDSGHQDKDSHLSIP